MSGFGVIARWSGTPDSDKVADLQAGIAARGRGSLTKRQRGDVVLVHTQSATTLEAEREAQPTRHHCRDIWLTADARIDNRDDLHRELDGHVQHPLDTDADFILAAYERWGDDLAQHLLGDFAFAIWDAERAQLLIVRDHLGIRPVYWAAAAKGGIVASSTLRATLEASGQCRTPDPDHLANFAVFSERDQDRSPWSAVRRLPGGHCLAVVRGGQVRTWQYWNPPDDHVDISVEMASTRLRGLLEEAVRCRLRAPSPIGVQLSGGFDSTTIAAVAAEIGDTSALITYALTFPGHDCDESAYIDAAEVRLGLRSRRLDALDVAPYDFAAKCRDSLDLAVLADTEWCTPLLHLAASDGCRVVLTGQGGDHALHGSPGSVTNDLLERRELRSAWRLLEDVGYRKRATAVVLARGMVLGHASRHKSGLVARLLSRRSRMRQARQDDSAGMYLGPALREHVSPMVPADPGTGRFLATRSQRRRHYTGGMNYFIGSWDDTATDGGIEYRHPFLDVRVIEFVVRLGEDVIAAGGRARSLHRQTFGDLLPQPTLNRTDKATFDVPWMNAALPPASMVGESENDALPPLIDQHALSASTAAYSTEGSLEFDTWSWWGAVAVGLWSLNCPPS